MTWRYLFTLAFTFGLLSGCGAEQRPRLRVELITSDCSPSCAQPSYEFLFIRGGLSRCVFRSQKADRFETTVAVPEVTEEELIELGVLVRCGDCVVCGALSEIRVERFEEDSYDVSLEVEDTMGCSYMGIPAVCSQ